MSDNQTNRDAVVEKFRQEIFSGWVPCSVSGPGAISRQVANLLGERHGSGYELSSHHVFVHRLADNSRLTLFAQTPVWALGSVSSTRDMLSKFGYERSGRRKLNCTLRHRVQNTQGLSLGVLDSPLSVVSLAGSSADPLYVWPIERLVSALEAKHGNAVLLGAVTRKRFGVEEFKIESLTFYSSPKSELFAGLVQDGSITVDHLISELPNGQIVEKGPIFKLERSNFLKLFSNVSTVYL